MKWLLLTKSVQLRAPQTGESLVEAQALPSDAGHDFGCGVLAQLGSIDTVKVVEEWAVGLKAGIEVLTSSPGQFAAYAKVSLQKKVRAENRVGAAGERNGQVVPRGTGSGGRDQRPNPKGGIELLAVERATH